jgi:hypothetical protein
MVRYYKSYQNISISEYAYQDIIKGITLPPFQSLELSDKVA